MKAEGRMRYSFEQTDNGSIETGKLVRWLVEERLKNPDEAAEAELAWAFHKGFAELLADSASYWAAQTGIDTIALSGGVMQNTLLLGMLEDELSERNLKVIRHHMIPPNDGGIALGQALYAREEVQRCV